MKIAFVDHYYHKTTRSTAFFTDGVLHGMDLTRFWDESWAGKPTDELVTRIVEGGFDIVIVFQAEHTARRLAEALRARGRGRLVFIPMWDGCRTLGPEFWHSLHDARILSFSRTLHERVTRLGLLSHHVQYFPDPSPFPEVGAMPDAAAFLWWRVPEIGWPQMRAAFGAWRPDRVHLHLAHDPQYGAEQFAMPADEDIRAYGIGTSRWFEDAAAFRATLFASNIFFAPRMSEGIGMAMLEAMAAGMCVVAHDAPTMNEYVVNGVNGLLMDMAAPAPVDLPRHRDIGRRARDYVARGWEAWNAGLEEVRAFVCDPRAGLDRNRFTALRFRTEGSLPPARKAPSAGQPKVTVATVVRDDPEGLALTIDNVARQDYGNLEYLVLDGGSRAETLDVIASRESLLTRWVSEPDLGPYDAMNRAAAMASGDYVIFLNAGDWFAGPQAVSEAMRDVPADADFVIGHHIYRIDDSQEELHQAEDFEQTWERLRNGPADARWLQGIPGHQATFTRTELLRRWRYDCRYRICADHEFMYRMRRMGARFHHSLTTLAVYVAGGYSAQQRSRLFDEWLELATRYGGEAAVAFFADIRRQARLQAVLQPPGGSGPAGAGDADDGAECGRLRQEIARIQQEAARTQQEAARLQQEVARMRNSASWIVTYPLRWAMRRAGPLRAAWALVPLPGRGRAAPGAGNQDPSGPAAQPAPPSLAISEQQMNLASGHDTARTDAPAQVAATGGTAGAADLPIHFFTIVLNGEPFIRYHEAMLAKLPFRWHWHVVEGVAALRHDTAWSTATGGRVLDGVHREGRSNDGTSEYLDDLAARFPGQVTVHRKPLGEFWDGKKEMVNAPLSAIAEECLLWQIDADELWTVDQVTEMRRRFLAEPDRSAACYWCWYFVGPDKVVSTRHNYAQNPAHEWLRTWRFRPGDHWAAHEPPTLVRPAARGGEPVDIATLHPFAHDETEAFGAVFQHFAYVTPAQLTFKESYYGYAGALAQWRKLLSARGPGFLADYFAWVKDRTMFDDAAVFRIEPLARQDAAGAWHFAEPDGARTGRAVPTRPRILVDGIYWQYLSSGIGRVWHSLFEEWVKAGLADHLILLDRAGTAPRIPGVHIRTIAAHDYGRTGADSLYLERICRELGADLFVSTYYSTPAATPSLFFGHDMIPEALGLDLSDEAWQEKARAIRHASGHLMVSRHSARDLARLVPEVAEERVAIACNGLPAGFAPADAAELAAARRAGTLPERYLLMVGDRSGAGGYKNGILAFRAAEQAAKRGGTFTLLCVGGLADIEPAFRAAAPSVSMRRIAADDAALRLLYSGAHALIYPSRYEGFGMPVLEAMACGCPVITCANSSLTEVGGEAAIYVDPDDAAGAAEAILALRDPALRAARSAAGIAQAARFTTAAQAEAAFAAFRATIEDLEQHRRPAPGAGWREFRIYQSGIQGWLQERPDLAREALAHQGKAGQPAIPARASGELLRALAEIEAMKNSPAWRLRGHVVGALRRLGLRHRG